MRAEGRLDDAGIVAVNHGSFFPATGNTKPPLMGGFLFPYGARCFGTGQLNAQVVTPFSCPIECCPYGQGSAAVCAAPGGPARWFAGRTGVLCAGELGGAIRLLVVAVPGAFAGSAGFCAGTGTCAGV